MAQRARRSIRTPPSQQLPSASTPSYGHVPRSSRTASDPVDLSTIHPTWVMPFIHGVQMMGRRSDPASKTPGNGWRRRPCPPLGCRPGPDRSRSDSAAVVGEQYAVGSTWPPSCSLGCRRPVRTGEPAQPPGGPRTAGPLRAGRLGRVTTAAGPHLGNRDQGPACVCAAWTTRSRSWAAWSASVASPSLRALPVTNGEVMRSPTAVWPGTPPGRSQPTSESTGQTIGLVSRDPNSVDLFLNRKCSLPLCGCWPRRAWQRFRWSAPCWWARQGLNL